MLPAGCILVPIVDHREFLAKFPAAFQEVASGVRPCAPCSPAPGRHPSLAPGATASGKRPRLGSEKKRLSLSPPRCSWVLTLDPRQPLRCQHLLLAPPTAGAPPAPAPPLAAEFDLPAIQRLFDGIDFVGVSAYIPIPDPNNFTVSAITCGSVQPLSSVGRFAQLPPPHAVLAIGTSQQLSRGGHARNFAGHALGMRAWWAQACDLEGLLHDLDTEMSFYGLSFARLQSKGAVAG